MAANIIPKGSDGTGFNRSTENVCDIYLWSWFNSKLRRHSGSQVNPHSESVLASKHLVKPAPVHPEHVTLHDSITMALAETHVHAHHPHPNLH